MVTMALLLFKAYLDPSNWGNVQHPLSVTQRQGSWEGKENKGEQVSVRLVKTPEEVTRFHILSSLTYYNILFLCENMELVTLKL